MTNKLVWNSFDSLALFMADERPTGVDFTTTIEIDGKAVEVDVCASVWPRNEGSRSEPPSGPEVSSMRVTVTDTGVVIKDYPSELEELAVIEFDSY